jgi:hypothetical protein
MNEKNHRLEPDEKLPQESKAHNTNEKSSPTDKAEEQEDLIGSRWWTWHCPSLHLWGRASLA